MRSALRLPALLLFLLALVTAAAGAQSNFTTVVVFGDSLSDTGNVAHLVQDATHGAIRYPADNPLLGLDYTDGRFTDGKDTQPAAQAYLGVWIEQLAASFAAHPAVNNSLDGGTNYAFGDATTMTSQSTLTEGPISITIDNIGQQVQDYLADVASNKVPAPGPNVLFVLWGGSDDLGIAVLDGNDPVAAAQTAAQNEVALVQQLVGQGATNFLIPNIPPLGATPEYAASPAGQTLNQAAATFAQALAQGLASEQTASTANGVTLTLYQPDIFDTFIALAANPMAVGLGNVTQSAQNITGSPDTYLIWDDIHPTTTGHHLAAATAVNLINPLTASSTSLTVTPAVLANQPATVTATVNSAGAAAAAPTGLVTFFSGTTAVGSAVLNASGAGTTTFTAAASSSPFNITAVYVGDTTYNVSASAAQPLTVLSSAVGTSTSLNGGILTTSSGQVADLTATVTPATSAYGAASGDVTFFDGATNLGTGTLSNGVAVLTTPALSAGPHSFTAMYGASGLFAASTSGAVAETVGAPGFTATANPASVNIKDGGVGTTTLTTVSSGGFSASITPTCGTLPAHLSCSIVALTSPEPTGQSQWTLTIATNSSVTAALERPGTPGDWNKPVILSAALLFPGLAGALLFGVRRRSALPRSFWLTSALLLLSAGAMFGLSGCGSDNDAKKGVYTVPVVFTPASGSSVAAQTVNLSVTVF